jgi:hypothetical protein
MRTVPAGYQGRGPPGGGGPLRGAPQHGGMNCDAAELTRKPQIGSTGSRSATHRAEAHALRFRPRRPLTRAQRISARLPALSGRRYGLPGAGGRPARGRFGFLRERAARAARLPEAARPRRVLRSDRTARKRPRSRQLTIRSAGTPPLHAISMPQCTRSSLFRRVRIGVPARHTGRCRKTLGTHGLPLVVEQRAIPNRLRAQVARGSPRRPAHHPRRLMTVDFIVPAPCVFFAPEGWTFEIEDISSVAYRTWEQFFDVATNQ